MKIWDSVYIYYYVGIKLGWNPLKLRADKNHYFLVKLQKVDYNLDPSIESGFTKCITRPIEGSLSVIREYPQTRLYFKGSLNRTNIKKCLDVFL